MATKICQCIRRGNSPIDVCRAAGVSKKTYLRWLRLGAKYPAGNYGNFRVRVGKAKNAFIVRAINRIHKAGQDDVTHLKWLLACTFPERFSQQAKTIQTLIAQVEALEAQVKARNAAALPT